MIPRGFDTPLYVLPFDHRGSFKTGMFGWKGALTPEQTAQIAAAILRDAAAQGYVTACPWGAWARRTKSQRQSGSLRG